MYDYGAFLFVWLVNDKCALGISLYLNLREDFLAEVPEFLRRKISRKGRYIRDSESTYKG